MRASAVLQRCLAVAFERMHALRRQTLLLAVEALIAGRRLVLIDLARSWPDAQRVRTPLKRLDRLLGNPRLNAERERIYGGMVQWLIRGPQPVILVDWCRLKGDGRWHLLRAAVPVGGRTLTLLDMVFPQRLQGSPQAEKQFLKALKRILPKDSRPILVADAGYRAPWCRAVEKLGWHWLVRLRHRTLVKPVAEPDHVDQWLACKALYALAIGKPRDLGLFELVRSNPLTGRLIVHAKPPKGRHRRTLAGTPARCKQSVASARGQREPWLLVLSPTLSVTPAQAVALYARRMQIELGFRDLKSHRFGQAFEDSLTRLKKRIEILLLLHALAVFAAWLTGLIAQRNGLMDRLTPFQSKRRLYSTLRLGWEALTRKWVIGASERWLTQLRTLPDEVLENMLLNA